MNIFINPCNEFEKIALNQFGAKILPPPKNSQMIMWGPIDPIGTIRVGKGWAYGPISSPRIRAYPRMINK